MPPMDPVCASRFGGLVLRSGAALLLITTAPVFARADVETEEPATRLARIVHRFDFDERQSGNLEDIPKYWEEFRPSGFAHFAGGAFDTKVGRAAPPSFHLDSAGRSVAYHYVGPETRVRTNSEYRIEGFVRADRLHHARAVLSAHFLDQDHRPIAGTMVRSRYVGGPDEADEWVPVELFLPAAPLEARTVGLMAWVLQEIHWNDSTSAHRYIAGTDVHGGAWFDDIVIHALPRVELGTNGPGNVLAGPGPVELQVVLADNEDNDLTGTLTIIDAAAEAVLTREVPVVLEEPVEPVRIRLDHFNPGLYTAELDVNAGEERVASRRLTFLRAAPWFHEPGKAGRPFGVAVDPRRRSAPADELGLLLHQGARSAKIPVWSGLPDFEADATRRKARSAEYQELLKAGFALTGVLHGPPGAMVRRGAAYPHLLLELLAGDPSAWKAHLATVVAPNATVFRWWQIGADNVDGFAAFDEILAAVGPFRKSMRRFITLPQLAVPAAARFEPRLEKIPVEQLSVAVGNELALDELTSTIRRYGALGYDRVTTYVEPLPEHQYRRLPRLADWAQRIITARHSGADVVFTPQTWRIRETAHGWVSEPTEEYLILRTIADVVGSAVPAERLSIAPSAQCLAFDRDESAVLVAWDPQAPLAGRDYAIQVGKARQQIDLWGHTTTLARDEHDRQVIHLSPLPIFVVDVERWLNKLRNSFTLQPGYVESGSEPAKHTIALFNSRNTALSAQVQLTPPPSWEVTPRNLRFNLMPRQSGRLPLEILYPHNERAGVHEIRAQIELLSEPYHFELPLYLEIGLKDVDVRGDSFVVGGELVLRHSVMNRTSDTLHFRATANVPGRERQHRPMSHLAPGQTQTVEFRFARGSELSGQSVRLGLREMNDGPRIHTLELRVP